MNRTTLPITFEAAAWIVKYIRTMSNTYADEGLTPFLGYCLSSESWDQEGHILDSRPFGHFFMGGCPQQMIIDEGYVEFEVLGYKLVTPEDTFRILQSKRLDLKTIKSGRNKSDQVLMAVPEM
jgi:hypothetical protein